MSIRRAFCRTHTEIASPKPTFKLFPVLGSQLTDDIVTQWYCSRLTLVYAITTLPLGQYQIIVLVDRGTWRYCIP